MQVQSLPDQKVKAFGKIDIAVLNAGIMHLETLDYDAHFNSDVKGPLFLAKFQLPLFPLPRVAGYPMAS